MTRKYIEESHHMKGRWTRWVRPVRKGYRMRCCDCDLVHELNFRKNGKFIEFQVARDNRSTAAFRRKK